MSKEERPRIYGDKRDKAVNDALPDSSVEIGYIVSSNMAALKLTRSSPDCRITTDRQVGIEISVHGHSRCISTTERKIAISIAYAAHR